MDLVDRNIKQRYLPFVLDPSNKINKEKSGIGGTPQIWSFRDKDYNNLGNGMSFGDISIMPSDNYMFDKDISLRLLTAKETKEFGSKDGKTTLASILDEIPAIQIREYTQDTRIDAILSLVDYFKEGMKVGGDLSKKLNTLDKVSAFGRLVYKDLKNIDIAENWKDILTEMYNLNTWNNDNIHTDEEKILIDFCYCMYYRIISTTTSNIYVFPYNASQIAQGNGTDGYGNDFGLGGGFLGKLFGQIGDFIAPNINITTTPIWKGQKGGDGVNIDLTVNLFNYDLESSIRNFICVNTIMPQNLPVQYGMLQGPPSLYDLKIEGGNRLFMCSGNFSCQYKGVLRTPSPKFLRTLFTTYNNDHMSMFESEYKRNLIKIPDIYELTLHFKSLLPNSFNSFLFQFYSNGNIAEEWEDPNELGLIEKDAGVKSKFQTWLDGLADKAAEKAINMDEYIAKTGDTGDNAGDLSENTQQKDMSEIKAAWVNGYD